MNVKTTEEKKILKKVFIWFIFIYGYLYVLYFLLFLFQIIFIIQTFLLILIIKLKFQDFNQFKSILKDNKGLTILTRSLAFLGLLVYLSFVYNPFFRLSINIVFVSVFSFFLLIFILPIFERNSLIVKPILEEKIREFDINILKRKFIDTSKELFKVLFYLLDESENKLLDLLNKKKERKFRIIFVLEYILYSFILLFVFLSVLDFYFVQWLNIIMLFLFIILAIREDYLLKIYECKFRKKRFSYFNNSLKLIYSNTIALGMLELKEYELIIKKINNYNSIKEKINFKDVLEKIIPFISICFLIFISFIKIETITLSYQNLITFIFFIGMSGFYILLFYVYPRIRIFRKLGKNSHFFNLAEILLKSLSATIKYFNQISEKETLEYIIDSIKR